jgi:inorganic triphosphatase YgiF
MAIEMELKFNVGSDEEWNRLRELDEIAGFRFTDERQIEVVDTYLDTADAAIRRSGFAFRFRSSDGRTTACLKAKRGRDGAKHEREEFEQIVDADQPVLDWPGGAVRDRLLDLSGGALLKQQVQLRQSKHQRDLVASDGRIIAEWSLDKISGGNRDTDGNVMELEIELKDAGSASVLDAIERTLIDEFGLTPETRTKLEKMSTHERHLA